MGKYRCASDSLRPGQLDRLTSKIKDCKPDCTLCGKKASEFVCIECAENNSADRKEE